MGGRHTTTLRRGEIVLLDFPFAEGSGKKVRPALVVQSERDNARMEATIVALVTKNLSRVDVEPTQFRIERNSDTGRMSGLLADSAVVCHHLFTVPQHKILKTIGSLSPEVMSRIDTCLSRLGPSATEHRPHHGDHPPLTRAIDRDNQRFKVIVRSKVA